MTAELCPYEQNVLTALVNGEMPANVREHLKVCAACQESELVWRYLATYAADEQDAAVPSVDLIWWRAQLAEKRRLANRSVAAIAIYQKAATALAFVFVAAAVVLWGSAVGKAILPWPVAAAALMLGVGSTGAIFYEWMEGRTDRILAQEK